MTDIFQTPEKGRIKKRLFEIGIQTLEEKGYKVSRIPKIGKSSVRKITKDGKSQVVSIRTSQDQCIAFPRLKDDSGWKTLDDVDMVVAVSVDDKDQPRNALVHFLDGDDMRDRFNRTYKARIDNGRSIPLGRGVWLYLYVPESDEKPDYVGAGAGLVNKAVAEVPLNASRATHPPVTGSSDSEKLTIAEAKRRLAVSLGVEESSIKITVEA